MKIEGKNPILEALKSDATIDNLLVEKGCNHEIIARARNKGVKIQYVDKRTLELSPARQSSGFMPRSPISSTPLERLDRKKERHFCILEK